MSLQLDGWYVRVTGTPKEWLPVRIGEQAMKEWASGAWRMVTVQLLNPDTGGFAEVTRVELHQDQDLGDGVFDALTWACTHYLQHVLIYLVEVAARSP